MDTLASLTEQLDAKPAASLRVENLSVAYRTSKGPFHAIDNVSFNVERA